MGRKAQRKLVVALAWLGLALGWTGCQGPMGSILPSGGTYPDAPQNSAVSAAPAPSAPALPAPALSAPTTTTPTVRAQMPANPGPSLVDSGMPAARFGSTPSQFPSRTGVPQASTSYSGPTSVDLNQDTNKGQPETVPLPRSLPNGNGSGEGIERIVPAEPGHPGGPIPGGPGFCPRELTPVSLPPYTIAPPDILYLDAMRLIPKPPYRIEPLEVVLINVTDTLPNQPILGQFVVSPEGMINLGYNYGSVRVGGLTLEQAQTSIREHLGRILKNSQVTLALAQFRGLQQVRGQHLVRPDGTISLGVYGAVYVAGLTLPQAKCVVEKHLSEFLLEPQVAVDILAYNSKVYFVIFDGGGFGQQVFRLPATGNETVLDAVSLVQGLAPISSKRRIWLARPAPANSGCSQILPVDWNAITQAGQTETNYQVFPGDRVYVSANRLIAFDNYLSMVLNPINRVMGTTLLTATAVNSVRFLREPVNSAVPIVPVVGR